MENTDKKYVVGCFSLSSQKHIYFNDAIPFPHLTEDPTEGKAMTFDEIMNYEYGNGNLGQYMSNWGKLHIVDVK